VGRHCGISQPFYYKIQSPVIFIELYAHSGIFLSNDDPEPFHIHNIIRTPNGNDYEGLTCNSSRSGVVSTPDISPATSST